MRKTKIAEAPFETVSSEAADNVSTKYIVTLTNLRLLLQSITLPIVTILLNFIFFYMAISNPDILRIAAASIFFAGSIVFYITVKKWEG